MKQVRRQELRHSITFTTVSSESDGMGSYTETVVDYFKTWAAIWPRSAKEFLQADQVTHEITHRIRIRYPHGYTITAAMVIAFGSRSFEIKSIINPEERNLYLDILAVEK